MIPSGAGWAHHAMTWDNSVDVDNSTLNKARWSPTRITQAGGTGDGAAPTWSLAADPINANRYCSKFGEADSTTIASLGDGYWLRHWFQNTNILAAAQIDERPSELWIEFEVKFDWDPTGGAGSHTMAWFRLIMETEASASNLGCIEFRNIGSTSATQVSRTGVSDTPTNLTGEAWTSPGGQTPTSAAGPRDFGTALKTDRWYTVRLHYVADPTPTNTDSTGSGLGGYVEVTLSEGSAGNGDTLSFSQAFTNGTPVTSRYLHGGGRLAGFMIGVQHENGNNVNACSHYYRNLCWGTTDPSTGDGIMTPNSGMTGAEPWFTTVGGRCAPHIGAMTASGSTVSAKVHGMYDRNQFEREPTPGTDTITWVLQWSTDPTFASYTEVTPGTDISSAQRYCYSLTIPSLPQNSVVYVRAKFGGSWTIGEYYSSTSRIKTCSATSPSTIKIVFGSCCEFANTVDPASALDNVPSEDPTFVLDLGDMTYLDSTQYIGFTTPALYVASYGTAAARKDAVARYNVKNNFGNCQWEKLARRASTYRQRDDHDWINAYGGASTATPFDFTSGDGLTLTNEVDEVYRMIHGCGGLSYDFTEASSTVNYFKMETARVAIFMLDTRRHFNRDAGDVSGALLGATQRTWILAQLAATTKPVVVLACGSPWHSTYDEVFDGMGGYSVDRDAILDACEANTSIEKVVLLGADRHYMALNIGDFVAWPKVVGSVVSSPWNQFARDPTTGETGINEYQTALGKTTSQVMRSYTVVSIAEGLKAVSVEFVNGETGATQYTYTSRGESGGGRANRVNRLSRVTRA